MTYADEMWLNWVRREEELDRMAKEAEAFDQLMDDAEEYGGEA